MFKIVDDMEILNEALATAITSFDFSFCISVNVLTYIINKTLTDIKGSHVSTWGKRLVLLISIVVIGTIWYFTKQDLRLIINSAILAPVFWSWIVKPAFKKFNIDYKVD